MPIWPIQLIHSKEDQKASNLPRTCLVDRIRDPKPNKLITRLKKLKTILNLQQLMSNWKRGPFVSLKLMSKCKNTVGLKCQRRQTFINKYPHSLRWVWLVVTDEREVERGKRDGDEIFRFWLARVSDLIWVFLLKWKKKKMCHYKWCDMKNNF